MTKTQRMIVLVAAVAVAVRVFFPIQYTVSGRERILISYRPGVKAQTAHTFPGVYPVTDVYTTILHVFGIGIIATALYGVAPAILASRRAKSGALMTAALIVAGVIGWNYWTSEQGQRPHFTRPLPPNPHVIVEGQRLGSVAVGMSLDEVRHTIAEPLSSASKDRTGMTAYWDTEQGRWIVHFDGNPPKAGSVGFVAFKTDEADLAKIRFETMKGARYGQSAETIKSLYGEPIRSHKEIDFSAVLLTPSKPSFPKSYYYPGIAFLFQCVGLQKESDCIDDFYTLYRVTVYAKGFSPDWAR